MVQPVYPMWARQRHVEGSVVLRVLIGKDGLVQQVDVVQGDPELAHAGVEAVRQWRYKPYQLNNQAVATTKDVTLNFKLE
jgi:protein TonB